MVPWRKRLSNTHKNGGEDGKIQTVPLHIPLVNHDVERHFKYLFRPQILSENYQGKIIPKRTNLIGLNDSFFMQLTGKIYNMALISL